MPWFRRTRLISQCCPIDPANEGNPVLKRKQERVHAPLSKDELRVSPHFQRGFHSVPRTLGNGHFHRIDSSLLNKLTMATVTLRQPLLAWEDSLLGQVNCVEQPKSRRKQHRSCDQCRKGKRGCDAVILHDFANSPGSLSSDFAGYHGEGTQGRGGLEIHSIVSHESL